jgi:biotin carboxyl carrier protein
MEKTEKKQRFVSINVDGGKYLTTLTEKYKTRKPYVENDPNLIRAFLPGTIVEVYTKVNKKVEEGDVLLILEAMKMRNTVVAPFSGIIKKVFVSLGQLVSKNFVMIEME